MGQFSQVVQPQTNQPQGKGGPVSQVAQAAQLDTQQSDGISRPMGKGGRVTYPGQGGQPAIGQPNQYSNTVGPWDNANIQQPINQAGKGKGH
jgi:hypothetical protein